MQIKVCVDIFQFLGNNAPLKLDIVFIHLVANPIHALKTLQTVMDSFYVYHGVLVGTTWRM